MSNEHKIKQSDVAWLRPSMLEHNQDKRCALCGHPCSPEEAALDHDHNTGRIRGVLHSSCNILLGKVENFVGRYGQALVREDRLMSALANMYGYMMRDYSHEPFHYKHMTEKDKLIRKYKRLRKRSKKMSTKLKYTDLIKEITNERS